MLIDLATQQKRNEERKGRMTKEKLKKYKQWMKETVAYLISHF
jgi:hypothetical protein